MIDPGARTAADVAAPGERTALVVVSHPKVTSYNHALARRAAELLHARGLTVHVRDLYAEAFDPVLPASEVDTTASRAETSDPLVAEHQRLLARAERLVVVHPNWWGKPPAMLAGWIDRVLAPGVAYRLDDPVEAPQPLLALRSLLVLNTSDTDADREAEVFGDPLQAIWARCVGEYMPSAAFERRTFGPIGTSTHQERQAWLDALDDLVAR